MADKTDSQRLIDLKAARKKLGRKKNALISLDDCAALWGVTKPRFVTKRKEMAGFPDMAERDGNAHLYPASEALRSMIDYIEGHQRAAQSKAKRLGELIGTNQMADQIEGNFSIQELAKANQLATELEQRARDQGLWLPRWEVERDIGMVFSEISEFLSNLADNIDPHGRLTPDLRTMLDSKAHEQLLHFHRKLKGMLSPHAVDDGTGKPDPKSGKSRTRRKNVRSNTRKAR